MANGKWINRANSLDEFWVLHKYKRATYCISLNATTSTGYKLEILNDLIHCTLCAPCIANKNVQTEAQSIVDTSPKEKQLVILIWFCIAYWSSIVYKNTTYTTYFEMNSYKTVYNQLKSSFLLLSYHNNKPRYKIPYQSYDFSFVVCYFLVSTRKHQQRNGRFVRWEIT